MGARFNAVPLDVSAGRMPWVRVSHGAPYFQTDEGSAWTPIGHNEALTWPRMASGRESSLDKYFQRLRTCGVTCLRLMLEYVQHNGHFFEKPLGSFNPRVVRRWDRIFQLGERHGIRLLLTPFDTFWMWKRWDHHPYNRRHGGTCDSPRRLLTCSAARAAMKARLAFAIDRWGHSGALFAWDLWNEIHPAYAQDDAGNFDAFIDDVARFVRTREQTRYGHAHLLTVSAFGPLLSAGFRSRELGQTQPDPRASAAIFQHPALDFATVHTYATGTIDAPRNTVDPAIAMGALTRGYIGQVTDHRPYFDSEHGPIHTFKDKRQTLPERFDDEYFRHLQWAHVASGGAGGSMRWPNRSPHHLTDGMHAAQAALARFLPSIDWRHFQRRNLTAEVIVNDAAYVPFCCGDANQAVLWLLRRCGFATDGTLSDAQPRSVRVVIPTLTRGDFEVRAWDTAAGAAVGTFTASAGDDGLGFTVQLDKDLALAVGRVKC